MNIEIRAYTSEWQLAVKAFNQRLKEGGVQFRFPEAAVSSWIPRAEGESLYEEYFLATEGPEVRGGYILKQQLFKLGEKTLPVGCLYLPLSEGTINLNYAKVGLLVLMDVLKRQPLLYCTGMGGLHNPLPLMLKAAGWKMYEVPFFFMINNPVPFMKNIAHLRRKPAMRIALDLAANTGLGYLGIAGLNYLKQSELRRGNETVVEQVTEFGPWVDLIWEAGANSYALSAVRNHHVLNRLYPAHKDKFLKLKITREGIPIGWAVTLDSQVANHKHFGNSRLGSIMDCFAISGCEFEVTRAATQFLRKRGVDLIVTNQSHQDWGRACQRCGFLSFASNYIFAASPKLSAQLSPFDSKKVLIHILRGDGEGPTHLS